MARYKIKLAYDGTDFSGFQRQQGARTVQETFETALQRIGWQGEGILAAGRTDTGVHATGQVAAFDMSWGHSEEDLLAALNANLPKEVAVSSVSRVEGHFHPRYDAVARQYVYTVICQPIRDPLLERFSWRQWPVFNLEMLNLAAACFAGEHDFRGFGRALKPGGATVREVTRASWLQDGDVFRFTIRANAFLYHMVRRIVFALALAGRGEIDPLTIKKALEDPEGTTIQGLAPAQGLIFEKVLYAEDL